MGGVVHASRRGRTALGVMLGVALTFALPAMATSDATAPAVAGMVLALATLLVLVPRTLSRTACDPLAMALIGDATPVILLNRVTDPVHHPLRPRAPGQA